MSDFLRQSGGFQPMSRPGADVRPQAEVAGSDVLTVLWGYKALILTVFFAALATTGFWLWIRDDAYEVSSKILIRYSRDAVSPRSSVSSSTAQFMPSTRPDLATEADLLRSLALIEQVVDDLGLDKPRPQEPPKEFLRRIKFTIKGAVQSVKDWGNEALYAAGLKRRMTDRESAIVAIAEALTVDNAENSSVLEAKFVTKYRDEAPIVLNELVKRYRERRLAVENNPMAVEFYRDQVRTYQLRLREKESLFEDVRERYGIYSDLERQTQLALEHFMDAENALRDVETQWAAAKARVAALDRQVASIAPVKTVSEVGERNALLDELAARRSELVLEREQLATKFQAGNVALLDIEKRIAKADELIEQTQPEVAKSHTTGVNPNHEQLELSLLEAKQHLAGLEALKSGRQRRVEELDAELAALRQARVDYSERKRDIALEEMTYSLHERSLEEAIAADAITSAGATSIIVIDPAVLPIKPVGMRKSYILGGAAGVGFVLALGLAFGFAALDETIRDPLQIEAAVGIPVVVTAGFDSLKRARRLRSGHESRGALGSVSPNQFDTDGARQLERAAFELASMAKGRANGHTLGSVALIGAHPGVGVSTLAASLKTALDGRFSSRTVVIKFDDDADAAPTTGAVLELQATTTRGVRCLPAGVSEKEMTNLARQLVAGETAPDMVLFDITAKPGSNETFAREAARKSSAADYRLLVVEAGRTKLGTVRELAREFDRTGLPIHGLILNKRKRPLPGFLSDKN